MLGGATSCRQIMDLGRVVDEDPLLKIICFGKGFTYIFKVVHLLCLFLLAESQVLCPAVWVWPPAGSVSQLAGRSCGH